MSTVYEALDTRIGTRRPEGAVPCPLPVAVAGGSAGRAIEAGEARAAGRLSHPNIVTVYEVGEQEGHHFIAMEYLNGPSLRARLAGGPVAPLEAAHILASLAEALDSAHAQGILHRDVKPDNVILLPDGRVKLADFGVARQIDDATLTQAGAPIGSPAYMSPEQVRGEAASPASDLWSLGVLLYEMLAGSLPFRGQNIPSVLHQVVYDPAPPLPGAPGKSGSPRSGAGQRAGIALSLGARTGCRLSFSRRGPAGSAARSPPRSASRPARRGRMPRESGRGTAAGPELRGVRRAAARPVHPHALPLLGGSAGTSCRSVCHLLLAAFARPAAQAPSRAACCVGCARSPPRSGSPEEAGAVGVPTPSSGDRDRSRPPRNSNRAASGAAVSASRKRSPRAPRHRASRDDDGWIAPSLSPALRAVKTRTHYSANPPRTAEPPGPPLRPQDAIERPHPSRPEDYPRPIAPTIRWTPPHMGTSAAASNLRATGCSARDDRPKQSLSCERP